MKKEDFFFYNVLFPAIVSLPFVLLILLDIFYAFDFSKIINTLVEDFLFTFNLAPVQMLFYSSMIGLISLVNSSLFEKLHGDKIENYKDMIFVFSHSLITALLINILVFLNHSISASAKWLDRSLVFP